MRNTKGEALSGAEVRLKMRGLTTITNSSGRYFFGENAVRRVPENRSAAIPQIQADGSGTVLRIADHGKRIELLGVDGKPVKIEEKTSLDPLVRLFTIHGSSRGRALFLRIDGKFRAKITCVNGRIGLTHLPESLPGSLDNLAKSLLLQDTLIASLSSYRTRRLALGSYTGTVDVLLTKTWRPFSDTSWWNSPIPANPEIDPDSRAMIDAIVNRTPGASLSINIMNYSIPVFFTDSATTPHALVNCTNVRGLWFDKPIPIPAVAFPDPALDHHLCVVDSSRNLEWSMWNAVKQGDSSWTAGTGAGYNLSGSGARPSVTIAQPWWMGHGCRASGYPLIAGLIRPEEIRAGRIEHALVFAYPTQTRGWLAPASMDDVGANLTGVPYGARMQLDPSINVDSLNIPLAGKIVARALQEYGMYVGDFAGAFVLYADRSSDALKEWTAMNFRSNVLAPVFNSAMLRRFQVLKLGRIEGQ